MRVAIFADSLPPSTDGVANTYCHLANHLDKEKITYRFFSPFTPGKEYSWSRRVRSMPYVPFFLYPHYRIALPGQKRLFRSLDRFRPNLIHVSSPTLVGYQAMRYARLNDIPAVAAYHTDFIAYFKYYGFNFAENVGWGYLRWFYNQFDAILAPSQSTRRMLRLQGFRNVILWQRGVNTELFNPKWRNRQNKIPRLLFVGRIVKEKDVDDLAAAYLLLNKNAKKCDLIWIGDGEYRAELQQRLPDCRFAGYLHGDDLAREYANADLFVFPSTTETFGNVILEALSSGLPVVTVDKGAVKDLVEDGKTGHVTAANDPAQLAAAVDVLLNDEKKRLQFARNARQYALNFSWDSINGKLLDAYKKLLSYPVHLPSMDKNRMKEKI